MLEYVTYFVSVLNGQSEAITMPLLTNFEAGASRSKASLGEVDKWFSVDCSDCCFNLKVETNHKN